MPLRFEILQPRRDIGLVLLILPRKLPWLMTGPPGPCAGQKPEPISSTQICHTAPPSPPSSPLTNLTMTYPPFSLLPLFKTIIMTKTRFFWGRTRSGHASFLPGPGYPTGGPMVSGLTGPLPVLWIRVAEAGLDSSAMILSCHLYLQMFRPGQE